MITLRSVTLQRGAKRLLDTINSVLDMARIEAGEMEMSLSACDIGAEIDEVLRLLRPLAATKGIELARFSEAEVDARLDTRLLNRILHNVIGNAVKFTEEGSVHVHLEATEDLLIIRVRDTGLGIAEAFLPHVFDEFKQESTGEARMFEGSGLGLAITYRIVSIMHGRIEAASTQGVGSAFTIVLPRYHQENPSTVQPGPAASASDVYLTEFAS